MPATRTLAPLVERGDLRELGVHLEGVAEQHAPAADQEQADAEQKHAADDERADRGEPDVWHINPSAATA